MEIKFPLNFKTEYTFSTLTKNILYGDNIQISLLWWQSSTIHLSNASSTKKPFIDHFFINLPNTFHNFKIKNCPR